MLLTIVGLIVFFGVVVLVAAVGRPDSFRLQRSTTVKAPPEKVFALINDFHLWASWSPWEKLDPMLQRTYSGPGSGKGSVYEWEGNPQVGKGRMEILEASAPLRILIKLDFLKPFKAHNSTEFTIGGQDNSTTVTWAMYGPQAFPAKVMSLFMSMDGMVGKDFEKGLASLKVVAEK